MRGQTVSSHWSLLVLIPALVCAPLSHCPAVVYLEDKFLVSSVSPMVLLAREAVKLSCLSLLPPPPCITNVVILPLLASNRPPLSRSPLSQRPLPMNGANITNVGAGPSSRLCGGTYSNHIIILVGWGV